jgi:hypothetical protein
VALSRASVGLLYGWLVNSFTITVDTWMSCHTHPGVGHESLLPIIITRLAVIDAITGHQIGSRHAEAAA